MTKRTVFLISKVRDRCWREERGSYSIEAALVVPIMLAIILFFILAGSYIYQTVVSYFAVTVSAERTAFSWDNSNRDYRSGILLEPNYDPLYSKLFANGVLGALFEWSGITQPQVRAFPSNEAALENSLNGRKLQNAANWLSRKELGLAGTVQHNQHLLLPSIEIKADKKARGSIESYSSHAVIVDPIEFIRNVQLFHYFRKKLKLNSNNEQPDDWSPNSVNKVIDRFPVDD